MSDFIVRGRSGGMAPLDPADLLRLSPLVFVVLVGGCASTRGSGSTTWLELTTPHFVLRTDLEAKTASAAAQALEEIRGVLMSAAWPEAKSTSTERTEAYVLADKTSFRRYHPEGVVAVFYNSRPPMVVLYGGPDTWKQIHQRERVSPLRRGISHQLIASLYSRPPRWFAVGLAQFLEAVELSEDKRSVEMGAVNISAYRSYLDYVATHSIPLERVLAWRADEKDIDEDEREGLEGTSWLLVHWLYNTRFEQFSRYQIELGRGTQPKRAWSIAFPGFDLDQAQHELGIYARHGEYTTFQAPARLRKPMIRQRELGPADAHAVRAQLALMGQHSSKDGSKQYAEAKTEVAEALRLDATNVPALRVEGWFNPVDRLPRIRRATEVHPDDPEAWMLLGSLTCGADPKGSECEHARRRAVALAPENPWALNELARKLLENGGSEEALSLAIRAANRAPWDAGIVDTYARALFLLGKCPAALKAQLRAADLLADTRRKSKFAAAFYERLGEYEGACGPSQ